jgi:hypothetical protein
VWPGGWIRPLARLRQRYDEAAAFGITHNRLRDWHDGNHPGYALGCWLQEYKEQVWLFTREFAVEWTTNSAGSAPSARGRFFVSRAIRDRPISSSAG